MKNNKWQKQKWIKKLKNETYDFSILFYITNSRKFTGAIIETETVYKIPDREIETSLIATKGDIICRFITKWEKQEFL